MAKYNMATRVHNTDLNIWNVLRELILKVLIAENKSVTVYGDGCDPDLGWQSFCNIYKYLILFSTPDTNVICQACLNKRMFKSNFKIKN